VDVPLRTLGEWEARAVLTVTKRRIPKHLPPASMLIMADVRFGSLPDMCSALDDVRFVPKADIPSLFDHLVGAGEYGRRHSEAKRLGRFQIEHHFERGWLLHR
jgi:hypothetical protein